jgi:2,3-bisphosphoglycerate-dependent phosphoglycerate mutase
VTTGPTTTPARGADTDGALVHLVRHGESVWNAHGLLQGGTAHVPLSVAGLEQSRRAADLLAERPVVQVWASDQLRCVQTAEIVAARVQLPVRRSMLLREQRHGIWEGKPAAGRAVRLARAHPDWAPAGGETARRLHQRAALFARLLAGLRVGVDDLGDVVVVSHGETLRALVAVVGGRGVDGMPDTVVPNGTVCSVRFPLPPPPRPDSRSVSAAARPDRSRREPVG